MIRSTLVALLLTSPATAETVFALPDPTMTPGAIDQKVTLEVLCNHSTKERRRVPTSRCEAVFAAYNIPPATRYHYECDHLVPLAIGGSNEPGNLWPQPNAEAAVKDALEVEMQRRACVAYRTLVPTEAAAVLAQEQKEIAEDWPTAYRRSASITR